MRRLASSRAPITGIAFVAAMAAACSSAPPQDAVGKNTSAMRCDTCDPDPGPDGDPVPTTPRQQRFRSVAGGDTTSATNIRSWDTSMRGQWFTLAEVNSAGTRLNVVTARLLKGTMRLDGTLSPDTIEVNDGPGRLVVLSDGTVTANTLRPATFAAMQHAKTDFAARSMSAGCAWAMANVAVTLAALMAVIAALPAGAVVPPAYIVAVVLAISNFVTATAAAVQACNPPPPPQCSSAYDCPGNQACNGGVCGPAPCYADADCPASNTCNMHICIPIPCGGPCAAGTTCVTSDTTDACRPNDCNGQCAFEWCDPIANKCNSPGPLDPDCDPSDLCCNTPNDPSCGGDGGPGPGGGGSCGAAYYDCY